MVAGGLVGLGGWVSSADAQYPPPGAIPPGMGMPGGMPMGMGMPGGGGGGMGMPMGMPGNGYAMPPSMDPSAMPSNSGGGFTPGAFGAPPMGAPADFPNASQPTGEPASPFSIKDEGMPNAFTNLHDPRRREAETYIFAFNGSYINWHLTSANTSAVLATTGSTSAANPGVLGTGNASVLSPNGNLIDYGSTGGYRLQMGIALGWMLPVEISGFSMNRTLNLFNGGSSDASGAFIGRPVQLIDQPGAPEAVLPVNIPGVLNGNLSITSRMSFWDVEANFLCNFCETDSLRLDFIFGYRYLDLYEALNIQSSSGGNVGASGTTSITDSFRTHNSFNGGQLGVRGALNLFEKMTLFIDAKIAAGAVHEDLQINGSTTGTTPAGVAQTQPGGLLALPSNIGNYGQTRFAIVPEGNISLSYQLHPHIRIFGGYNVLYVSSVVRPGDSITNAVDSRQVPVSTTFAPGATNILGPNQPGLVTHGLFANGYNVGIEIGF
jgi:hypothetical protein